MAKQVHQAAAFKSVDAELADALQKAEESLIRAVELFGKGRRPDRSSDYVKRLTRAQELVTTLFREELVRKRGPIRLRRKK